MLCSDGGASLTLNHDCSALRSEFFVPLVTGIKNEVEVNRENFLYEAVATDKTWALTNDDKTLLFCFSDTVISTQDELSINAGEVKKQVQVTTPVQINKSIGNSVPSPQSSSTRIKSQSSTNDLKSNSRSFFTYLKYLLLLLFICVPVAFVYFGAQLDFVKKHFNSSVEQTIEIDKPKQDEVSPSEEQEKPKPGLPSEEIKKSIQNKQKIQKI
jgi:hypothetical protein